MDDRVFKNLTVPFGQYAKPGEPRKKNRLITGWGHITNMGTKNTIFDENWIVKARSCDDESSWVKNVMTDIKTTGGLYLSILKAWFNAFPLQAKQKRKLKSDIENFKTEEHLGAVNELVLFSFLKREKFQINPIPVAKGSTPDFSVSAPFEFYLEVTTLNVSQQDKKKIEKNSSIQLNHDETLRRVLGKLTDEKQKQLAYASDNKKPGVLVLFDYTTWSGFSTEFYRYLARFLFGGKCGFLSLPPELSALVYIERRFFDSRFAISRSRSAAYYNPYAKYPLTMGSFTTINQFWAQMVHSEPVTASEAWVYL